MPQGWKWGHNRLSCCLPRPPPYSSFLSIFRGLFSKHVYPTTTDLVQGTWAWLADHNLDGDGVTQITVYSGRGILSQSLGPVWLIGTGQ